MSRGLTKTHSKVTPAFGRLTNRDLTTFDQIAKNLILDAIAKGCTGRISAKGHCILHNNTGGTASVPRNMTSPNRASQNARTQIRKLLATHRSIQRASGGDFVERSAMPPQQISITRAFTEHGAAFSSWVDQQSAGLPGDATIQVSFGIDGNPTFEQVTESVPTVGTTSTTRKQEVPSMSTTNKKAPGVKHERDPDVEQPRLILQQIREVLGEDPRIAELKALNQRLAEENERQLAEIEQLRSRVTAAEAKISLLKETLSV